jgi:hypothetical protein
MPLALARANQMTHGVMVIYQNEAKRKNAMLSMQAHDRGG